MFYVLLPENGGGPWKHVGMSLHLFMCTLYVQIVGVYNKKHIIFHEMNNVKELILYTRQQRNLPHYLSHASLSLSFFNKMPFIS
jgi:hypothetical protein